MKKSLPIFWQLYMGVIAGLTLIAFTLVAFLIYQDEKTAIEDFYFDTDLIASKASTLLAENRLNQNEIELLEDLTFFKISLLPGNEYADFKADKVFIERIEDVEILADERYEALASAYPITVDEEDIWLIIQDTIVTEEQSPSNPALKKVQESESQEDQQAWFTIYVLVFSVILVTGIILFFLIHQLSKHIEALASVSEQWRNGQLKAQANIHAPQPIGGLAHSLNTMAAGLHQSIQEKEIMLHAISHELRNPLNAFELALELLQRKYHHLKTEPLIADLQKYSNELHSLTSGILNLAKLNHADKLNNLETINLTELIGQRILSLKTTYPKIEVTFKPKDTYLINGHQVYLQLALDNLISNAFKYANNQVSVQLNNHIKAISMVVEDDGAGIPEDKFHEVLLPFSRLDESRNKTRPGFGLGLAIAHSALQKHHASLQLSRSEMGGLRIEVIFSVK